jgi:predicted dithiol-disulfide oxidoreductase (DUF899 family)
MTLARPSIVDQAEWDEALAAMTERERTVAAAMHELAAHGSACQWFGFSTTFGVDEWFGFTVFLRDGNDVYRTYFLQHGAMVQWIGSIWSVWSLTPYGGQSDDEELPEGWPRAPQLFWFRRHDEFDDPPPSAASDADAIDQR